MRCTAKLVSCLVVGLALTANAQAQVEPTVPPAPSAPPLLPGPEVPVIPPPAATSAAPVIPLDQPSTERGPSLADRTSPQRASRFSAGRGGALFAFAETIDGLVVGGVTGAGFAQGTSSSGVYLGAIAGGLVLGGLGFAVQYVHPIGLASAATISLGIGVGALAGAGIAAGTNMGLGGLGLLMLAGSQLGMAIPLALLWSTDDMNGEDVALLGMCSIYGFALAALVSMIAVPSGPSAWALLTAPALGMALGGVWAWAVDMAPGRVLKLTALPLGVGAILFFLGTQLATMQTTGITTLLGMVATFGLTYIFTMETPPPEKMPGVTVRPSVSFFQPARRNDGMTAGPAMSITF